jgi:hypothetical protein
MAGRKRARELLSSGDVAKLLGYTDRRIRQLADGGEFAEPAGVLPGGRRVWKRADIERWVRARKRTAEQ